MTDIKQKLHTAAPIVFEQTPVLFAYLYGSHAKGLSHPFSDMDIGIFVEDLDIKACLDLELSLALRIDEKLDHVVQSEVRVLNHLPLVVKGRILGEAELIFSQGKVEVNLPFLNNDTVEFDRVVIKCNLKNRSLNLGRMEFTGPALNASISGNIILNRQWLQSRLNLRGEIEPLPELIQKLSDNPSTLDFLKRRLKSGKLTFTVSGTLDNPQMRIS